MCSLRLCVDAVVRRILVLFVDSADRAARGFFIQVAERHAPGVPRVIDSRARVLLGIVVPTSHRQQRQ